MNKNVSLFDAKKTRTEKNNGVLSNWFTIEYCLNTVLDVRSRIYLTTKNGFENGPQIGSSQFKVMY